MKTLIILVAALALLLTVSAPAGACYAPGAYAQGVCPSYTVITPTSVGTGSYLGCPGCPGCPDGNGTPANPGDPGCL